MAGQPLPGRTCRRPAVCSGDERLQAIDHIGCQWFAAHELGIPAPARTSQIVRSQMEYTPGTAAPHREPVPFDLMVVGQRCGCRATTRTGSWRSATETARRAHQAQVSVGRLHLNSSCGSLPCRAGRTQLGGRLLWNQAEVRGLSVRGILSPRACRGCAGQGCSAPASLDPENS